MEDNDRINIKVPSSLPSGWELTTIENISSVIMGQSPPSSTYNEGEKGLPFFQGKTEFGELYPVPVKWCSEPNKIARKDDVLISVRAPVGPTNLAPSECCIGRGLAAIRPSQGIPSKYILYYLRSIESAVDALGTGTTFKAISGGTLRQLPIALAPQNQRQLIVAEIEKQFSRLDEAVVNLKRVKANLKRYKAAVLKAAVEGKLTEEWRKAHPDVESASELLKRILAERKRKWEIDNPKKSYKQPDAPETSSLPILPVTWSWATVEYVADAIDPQPSHRTPPEIKNGIPYIGMGDIDENGKFDVERARKVAGTVWKEHKNRYALREGDFIFGKIGTIGKPVKLYPPFNYTLSANVVLIQPASADILPQYCFVYIDSPLMDSIIRNESRATTQAAFGIQKVRRIPIPIPPNDEQRQITLEIDRRLSIVCEAETQVDTNLKRADRLRQTILGRAFQGNLIQQENI